MAAVAFDLGGEWDPEIIEEAIQRVMKGDSYRVIQEELGVPPATLHRYGYTGRVFRLPQLRHA